MSEGETPTRVREGEREERKDKRGAGAEAPLRSEGGGTVEKMTTAAGLRGRGRSAGSPRVDAQLPTMQGSWATRSSTGRRR